MRWWNEQLVADQQREVRVCTGGNCVTVLKRVLMLSLYTVLQRMYDSLLKVNGRMIKWTIASGRVGLLFVNSRERFDMAGNRTRPLLPMIAAWVDRFGY